MFKFGTAPNGVFDYGTKLFGTIALGGGNIGPFILSCGINVLGIKF
jgi:hypothetical protein